MKRLLIDADILAFRAACVYGGDFEVTGDDGAYMSLSCNDLEGALAYCNDQLKQWLKRHRTTSLLLCWTASKSNFRKELYPLYKANRGKKPSILRDIAEALSRQWPSMMVPGLEADDLMGIIGSKFPSANIICTIDKDLLQIPSVQVWNWNTDDFSVSTPGYSDKLFLTQVITGDSTDNYPGIKGYGRVKAERLLSYSGAFGFKQHWNQIVEAAKGAGMTLEELITQARLARILRYTDIHTKGIRGRISNRMEPILWLPDRERSYERKTIHND